MAEKLAKGYDVNESGCWIWNRDCTPNGYGKVWVDGKYLGTHQAAYETWVGPIPEGLDVGHKCHDEAAHAGLCARDADCPHRACINPEHLKAETRQENLMASPWTEASRLSKPDEVK